MDVHEEGTVTGSIDVAKLDQIEPKTDEARAQLDTLKAQVAEGQQQADAGADRAAEVSQAQSADAAREAEVTTTEAGAFGNQAGDGFASNPDDARQNPAGEGAQTTTADAAQGDAEVDQLRAEAESLGVKVDKRWGADRLRSEIDAARDGV